LSAGPDKPIARRLKRRRRSRRAAAAEAAAPAEMPREILDRIQRVREYHESTKHTYASVRTNQHALDWSTQPSPFRIFREHPKVELPRDLKIPDPPALAVLSDGVSAARASADEAGGAHTPQDLRTLAHWLHLACGITSEVRGADRKVYLRSCPSSSALFPFEVYVAAFGIEGLEPGLYHFSVKEHALRKLRDGHAALAQIKKGRPDLEFLKTVPAALLVSTIFCRSAWRYRNRGYRYALVDAGHLVQNLVTAANGLGIQTTTRLGMNDRTARELIGSSVIAPFAEAEAVQAMVVWAETAVSPIQKPDGDATSGNARGPMAPIPREPLTRNEGAAYEAIGVAHEDCVAPGVAVRGIRPPLTELRPVRDDAAAAADLVAPETSPANGGGGGLRDVMTRRRSARDFRRDETLPLDAFWTINRLAFRGGSHFPVFPSGPHVGLVRPMWIVNAVDGLEPGIWHYDCVADAWHLHRAGGGDASRLEAEYLCLEQPIAGNAAAVGFLIADLNTLMDRGGPDTYRLAHLEAGIAAQRMFLAASALGVGSTGIGPFYDDETVRFVDPAQPGWEAIYSVVLGPPKQSRSTST
jgi:SagB-type dehydrogenase family enzyme